MWGGIGDDKLWGQDGHDNLTGGVPGVPALYAEGNDELYGGAGPDELSAAEVKMGGPGDDLCKGDKIQFKEKCDDDP